jgi:hypothetical protein
LQLAFLVGCAVDVEQARARLHDLVAPRPVGIALAVVVVVALAVTGLVIAPRAEGSAPIAVLMLETLDAHVALEVAERRWSLGVAPCVD